MGILFSILNNVYPQNFNDLVDHSSSPLNVINREISTDYSSLNQLFDDFRNSQNINMDEIPDIFRSRFDGSPFLVQKWSPSQVVLKNGKAINYDLLYNVFKNEFWIKKEDRIVLLNLTDEIDYIEFDGKKFMNIPYDNEKKQIGLQELLVRGEFSLFKLYSCIFLRNEHEATGYESTKKDKFQIREEFYYQDTTHIIRFLPLKKRNFFSVFGEKAEEAESYWKKHKFKLKKETDLIQLFTYLNSK